MVGWVEETWNAEVGQVAAQHHPVGQAIAGIIGGLANSCTALITAGRESGALPAGPPPAMLALAFLGVLEAVGSQLAGQAPYDVEIAERAARGLLGLPPMLR